MKLKVNLFVSMCIGTDDINIADAVRLPEGRKDPRSSYPSKFRLGPHTPARHGPPCVRPSGWSRRRGAVVARAAVARAARAVAARAVAAQGRYLAESSGLLDPAGS